MNFRKTERNENEESHRLSCCRVRRACARCRRARLCDANLSPRRIARRAREHPARVPDGGRARLRVRVRRLPLQGRARIHLPRLHVEAYHCRRERQGLRRSFMGRDREARRRCLGEVEGVEVRGDAPGAAGGGAPARARRARDLRRSEAGAGDRALHQEGLRCAEEGNAEECALHLLQRQDLPDAEGRDAGLPRLLALRRDAPVRWKDAAGDWRWWRR